MTTEAHTACPSCGHKGRKVKPITPQSLLNSAARARLGTDQIRFCRTSDCDTVYFDEGQKQSFSTSDLTVPVFQKDERAQRPVCYCFDHTVLSIEAEVQRTGGSEASTSIAAKCKAGLDACDENNPQGSCCLGNVRQVVKAAVAARGVAGEGTVDDSDHSDDCCASEHQTEAPAPPISPPRSSAGLWMASGSVLSALLASACCWLPLALIGVGISTAGVAGFFETYRLVFLGATGVLLSAGFYFVYVRKPKCAPGEVCEMPNPTLQRLNKLSLWVATVLVIVFASFPNYVGALFGGTVTQAAAPESPTDVVQTYAIEGMTCEGCATHLTQVLSEMPGVTRVEVSYPNRTASMSFASGQHDDQAVAEIVSSIGYAARPIDGSELVP